MGQKFNDLVDEALAVEKELRALSGDKASIGGWVSACLSRGGLVYEDVEAVKERLGSDFLQTRMVDSGAYCRDLRKYIAGGSVKEPPAADKIHRMFFAQRDGAVAELGGEPRMLFALFAIVAERVYQEKPELFGGTVDIDGRKARLAELAARREELYADFPLVDSWRPAHREDHLRRGGVDHISNRPDEIPLHPFSTAGERLIEFLLRKEHEAEAKAA